MISIVLFQLMQIGNFQAVEIAARPSQRDLFGIERIEHGANKFIAKDVLGLAVAIHPVPSFFWWANAGAAPFSIVTI